MATIRPTVDSSNDKTVSARIIGRSITELQDNIITTLHPYALYGCAALKKVVFGSLPSVPANAFFGCTVLETADFYSTVTITSGAFYNCKALAALILRSETKCTLTSSSGLNNTGIALGTGYIYVPSALVSEYANDACWGTYQAQIRAIEDYPAACSDLGRVWTTIRRPDSSSDMGLARGLEHANGLWVASRSSSGGLYYSEDGINWTVSNITDQSAYSIKYANGLWVASCSSNVYTSLDGKEWTLVSSNASALGGVDYANGLWVLAGNGGIYYSEDGTVWTKSDSITATCRFVGYANGLWFAVANSKGLWYSEDGKTWTQSNYTSLSVCGGVVYENGLYVAGTGSGILYSEDGKTWTQSGVAQASGRVLFVDGLFVCGMGNGLCTSTDGKKWTVVSGTSGNAFSSGCLDYALGIWIASANNRGLWYSTDGYTWSRSNITSGTPTNAKYADGVWVVTNTSGYYSTV